MPEARIGLYKSPCLLYLVICSLKADTFVSHQVCYTDRRTSTDAGRAHHYCLVCWLDKVKTLSEISITYLIVLVVLQGHHFILNFEELGSDKLVDSIDFEHMGDPFLFKPCFLHGRDLISNIQVVCDFLKVAITTNTQKFLLHIAERLLFVHFEI